MMSENPKRALEKICKDADIFLDEYQVRFQRKPSRNDDPEIKREKPSRISDKDLEKTFKYLRLRDGGIFILHLKRD